jgi:hypothetical protein
VIANQGRCLAPGFVTDVGLHRYRTDSMLVHRRIWAPSRHSGSDEGEHK